MTIRRTSGEARGPEPVGDRVRIFRRGRVWQANYQRDRRQVRTSLRTTNLKEARRRAARIEADLAQGRALPAPDPALISATIDAYLEFLRTEGRSPKTLAKYNTVFARVRDLA